MIRKVAKKLIDTGTRITGSDMNYVARSGSRLFGAEIISTLSVTILALGYARFLTPETYGEYKYLIASLGLIGAFSLTGLSTSLMRSAARGLNSLRAGVTTNFIWSLLASLAGLCASGYYFFNGNAFLGGSFLIIAIAAPFYLSASLYSSFLIGKKRFVEQTRYRIARVLITTSTLLTVIYLSDDPMVIFATYLLVHIGTGFFFLWLTDRLFRKTAPEKDAEMVSYAKHLTAMNIFGRIVANLDSIVMFQFLGPVSLAIYSFALAFPRQIKNLNGIVVNLIFPKITEKSLQDLRRILPYKVLLFTGVLAAINVVYILLAPFAYKLFFPQYLDSIFPSQVFSLTLVLSAPMVFFSEVLVAHKRKKELYIMKSVVPVVKVALLFALVPMYGIWGGVFALLGAQVINLSLLTFFFLRLGRAT